MKRLQNKCGAMFLALVFALATIAFGCSRPAEMPSASAPWVASLLGSPSHFGVVLKPSAFLSDPYWGPALRRGMAKPSSRHDDADDVSTAQIGPFLNATQMELFITVRDFGRASGAPKDHIGAETVGYVFVIRGVGGVDPTALTTKRGDRLFSPPIRLQTGVLEFPPSQAWGARKRGLASFLYILPDGTWVGVDANTAPRARAVYMQTPASPPPMKLDSDGLLAGFVDRTVLDAATKRAELLELPWKHDLTGGGLVLFGGRDGAIELVLEYANSDSASTAKSWMEDLLVAACKEHEMACLLMKAAIRDVKTTRDGRRVGIRFYLTEALLKRLSDP